MTDPSFSGADSRPVTDGFVLPEPLATLDLAMDDGAAIRVVRHGNPSGVRVVLSHGNGFASDSYFPFWQHMLERFDLALFDVRNCGRNPFHAAEPHHYPRFARDNTLVHGAIAREWGEKTTVGVFHSMTAIAALLDVVDGVWHWDALVLFDPPMVPPEENPLCGQLMSDGGALRDAALIRQNRFRHPEDLVEVYKYLHRFRRLREGVPELNARSVLHFDSQSEEWLLRCPGPVEAGLYTEVAELDIWRQPDPPDCPLLIIGADPTLKDASKTASCCKLFCETFGIDYAFVPDTSHLLQLEEPEQCFALFDRYLTDNSIIA